MGIRTVRGNTWNHVNTLAKTGKYTKPHGITYDVCATIRGDTCKHMTRVISYVGHMWEHLGVHGNDVSAREPSAATRQGASNHGNI